MENVKHKVTGELTRLMFGPNVMFLEQQSVYGKYNFKLFLLTSNNENSISLLLTLYMHNVTRS